MEIIINTQNFNVTPFDNRLKMKLVGYGEADNQIENVFHVIDGLCNLQILT